MIITKTTRLIDIVNHAAANPGILEMNVGGITAIADGNEESRLDGLSPQMGLSEFYFRFYRQQISVAADVKSDTLYCRELALRLWKELTGDPPMAAIDVATVNRFVIGMRKKREEGIRASNATIRKHCMALASILNIAGPRCHEYPRAVGLIPMPPKFPPIQVHPEVSGKTPTLEEFAMILKACRVAKWPIIEDISPAQWWRSVYALFFNTGLRRSELFSACWCHIREQRGKKFLEIPCLVEKTNQEKKVPLNAWALAALETMPRLGRDTPIIQVPGSNTTIQRWRERIAFEAGLPVEKCQFRAMRRMVANYVENPQKVLGHASETVTRLHYQSLIATARYLDALPQPEWSDEDDE